MSLGSNRRADHTNRIVLTAVGAAAVLLAGAGLARSYAGSGADRPPIDASRRAWLLDHGTVLGAMSLVVAVALTVLALRWLRHQFVPVSPASDATIDRTDAGSAVLRVDALTTIVEAELVELRGVIAADARIREREPDTIEVILDVDDDARLPRIAQEAGSHVLARARRATGRDQLALVLECRPGIAAPPPRVA